MRVFVLNTGRCGSTSLTNALRRLPDFTCKQEETMRAKALHLEYPDNHIAIDHRLAWALPYLKAKYRSALFVDLKRTDRRACIASMDAMPLDFGAFMAALFFREVRPGDCELYHDTVRTNIDATHCEVHIELENPKPGLWTLLSRLGREGQFKQIEEIFNKDTKGDPAHPEYIGTPCH